MCDAQGVASIGNGSHGTLLLPNSESYVLDVVALAAPKFPCSGRDMTLELFINLLVVYPQLTVSLTSNLKKVLILKPHVSLHDFVESWVILVNRVSSSYATFRIAPCIVVMVALPVLISS